MIQSVECLCLCIVSRMFMIGGADPFSMSKGFIVSFRKNIFGQMLQPILKEVVGLSTN